MPTDQEPGQVNCSTLINSDLSEEMILALSPGTAAFPALNAQSCTEICRKCMYTYYILF